MPIYYLIKARYKSIRTAVRYYLMRKYLAAFFYFDNLLTSSSRMCGCKCIVVDATIQKVLWQKIMF